MAPKRKQSAFQGTGRSIGGKVVKAKLVKLDEDDEFKTNISEDEEDEGLEAAIEDHEIFDLDNTIEIADEQGNVIRMARADSDKITDEEALENAKKDDRFAEITERRIERLARVIIRVEANSGNMHENEVDMSEHGSRNAKGNVRVVPCKVGIFYLDGQTLTGKPRLKAFTDKELKELEEPSEPCDCEICVKRRENDAMIGMKPVGTSRSGLKRTFEAKYGDPHSLEKGSGSRGIADGDEAGDPRKRD